MRIYDYIFFTFYRFWEKAITQWWSDWKASLTMVFSWIVLVSTINNIQMLFYERSISDYPIFTFSLGGAIIAIHYYIYIYNDKWKDKILKFRNINKRKDRLGIVLIILISTIIIFCARYTSYLLSSSKCME